MNNRYDIAARSADNVPRGGVVYFIVNRFIREMP